MIIHPYWNKIPSSCQIAFPSLLAGGTFQINKALRTI